MAKLTKIVNGNYIGPNKYKITDSSNGKKEIVFSPDQVLTEGTPVGAEILNEIQKNGLYYLEGTKRVSGKEDIYDCTLEGIDAFEFTRLNVLFKPNVVPTQPTVKLNVSRQVYTLTGKILSANQIGLILVKSELKAYTWASQVEIVNDLTTGGANNALSGEMGKKLKKQVDEKLGKGTFKGDAQDLKDDIDKKEPKITRSNATNSSSDTDVATSKAVKDTMDRTTANMGTTQNGNFPLTSATVGNTYRAANGKLYKCIKAYSGTSISVPNANFEELSIFKNSEKISKMNKIQTGRINIPTNNSTQVIKVSLPEPFSTENYAVALSGTQENIDSNYTACFVSKYAKNYFEITIANSRAFTMSYIAIE